MDTVHYIDPNSDQNETRLEILKTQVQNLTNDQMVLYVSQLEKQWCLDRRGDEWIPIMNCFRQFFQENELNKSG